jgi:CubicO group peptidase (beta-lactamase class C family)
MNLPRLSCQIVALVIVASVLCVTGSGQAVSPEQARDIDRIFTQWNRSDSPGCALAVMENGQITYEHGYGMADLEHGAPIMPATPFHVASVSKQFTAAAIVLLAEQGKLSIDDDVRKYIPELPDYGVRITIRNLLHHTSGLRDQWDLLDFAGWRYSLDLITNQDVLDVVTRQKELNFRPGDRFAYSNTGFTLLGEIVRRVSAESLRQFTTERIFNPLNMANTHFRDDHAEIIKGEAYGYVRGDQGRWRLANTNFDTVGATSLFTTVEDLSRWDENFYTHKIGGSHFTEQMLHREPLNDGTPQNYAFGLIVSNYRGLPLVEHLGADAGYRAGLIRFPGQHFSVACLCNAGWTTEPRSLSLKVADLFLGGQYKQPARPSNVIHVPPEQLRSLVGTYWNKKTDWVGTIILSDGMLQLLAGGDSIPLPPLAPDLLQIGNGPDEFRVIQPANGRSTTVQVVSEYGMPDTFEMLPPFTLRTDLLAEYVGTYVSDEVEPVYRISQKAGKLVLRRLKHKPDELQPVARDLFRGDLGTVHFIRDNEGQVSGMLLSSDRVYGLRLRKQSQTRR